MLTAVVGALFSLGASALLGLAADQTSILRTGLLLGALLLLSAAAAVLFASRSSLGALITGLTALTAQSMVFLAPIHAASLTEPWLQRLVSTGFMLALAGLWLGGSWGMRLARRAGQAQGHAAFRLTEADRTVGSTPTPPPSRRRDHLLSLPWVIAGLALAAFLLPRTYLRAVAPGVRPGRCWSQPSSSPCWPWPRPAPRRPAPPSVRASSDRFSCSRRCPRSVTV